MRQAWWLVVGAYLNLERTRLSSSLLLGLPVFAALAGESSAFMWALGVASYVLFPLCREMYFRATAGLRDGLDGIVVWGPLVLVVFLIRFLVYLALLMVASIPLGLVGLVYLRYGTRRELTRRWR